MRFSIARRGMFLALLSLLLKPAFADAIDTDRTQKLITELEQAWIAYEIGDFSSGKIPVYAGTLDVTQTELGQQTQISGEVLAVLSKDEHLSLTIIFQDKRNWISLKQTPSEPRKTYMTRIRGFASSDGVLAQCEGCLRQLSAIHPPGSLLLNIAGTGKLYDVRQSPFTVQLSGFLEQVSPTTLSLEDILLLRPEKSAYTRRPKGQFERAQNGALRRVSGVFKADAPEPDGAEIGAYSCYTLTAYETEHSVRFSKPIRATLGAISLGKSVRCCVDHAGHDATRHCEGLSQ